MTLSDLERLSRLLTDVTHAERELYGYVVPDLWQVVLLHSPCSDVDRRGV